MKKQLTLLFYITTSVVMAQTNTWLGNTTAWNLATNWSLGSAPITAPAVDVVIPSSPSGGQFPVITINSPSIGQLTIQDGATITVNNNTFLGTPLSLIVNKSVNAGTGSGSVINGTGFLVLQGAAAQTISGKLSLRKFRLNNTNGASLNAGTVLNVDSFMLMQAGTLTTTGASLVLRNNAYINTFSPNTYTGAINGPVTVQRFITNTADGYRNFSSPVATTVADLADDFSVFGQNAVQCWYAYSPYPNLQEYNEALSIVNGSYYEGWLSYTGTGNVLSPMKGIAARTYEGAPYTIDFTGQPNDGPQSIAITNTPTSTPADDGWNLIGNPYPSPIRWSALKALNPGEMGASYYVFQTTGEYSGNWGSHNGVTGVNGARDSIGIAQGFFVQASGNSTLEMNNTVRAASFSGYFKVEDVLPNEVRLVLSDNTNSDEIVAYTNMDASPQFDAEMDAVKMPAGSTIQLSFNLPDRAYAIHVTDVINEQTILPLKVLVNVDGIYTLQAIQLNTPGLRAYLRDASTGYLYDLSAEAPAFSFTGGYSYADRFSVVFEPDITSVNPEGDLMANVIVRNHELHIKQRISGVADVKVSNLIGQEISGATIFGSGGVVSLPVNFKGVAVVHIAAAGKLSIRKIFVH